jgi:hypothetical protein
MGFGTTEASPWGLVDGPAPHQRSSADSVKPPLYHADTVSIRNPDSPFGSNLALTGNKLLAPKRLADGVENA